MGFREALDPQSEAFHSMAGSGHGGTFYYEVTKDIALKLLKETEIIFNGYISTKLPTAIQHTAKRKLDYLDVAVSLQDLMSPPGNRLESMKGSLLGTYSIRINQQWRICFEWNGNHAENVQIIDYH